MHTSAPHSTRSREKPTAADTAIDLRDLRKGFGTGDRRVVAVDGVSIAVRRGEIVALLGPNGAGKTTTIDMLLGLTQPDGGSVSILGGSPSAATSTGSIAAVLQTGGLLSDLSVGETVQLIASLYGRGALSRVPEVLKNTDLEELKRRRVSKCSGGEQQRIKFALALIASPDVLVLDEPTAGMDVNARRRFWTVMREQAETGRTIIFATHYLEEAEQFAHRTIVMNHGKVVADAPTAELRSSLGARLISATLPSAGRDDLLSSLAVAAGISDVRVDADRLFLRAADSDTVAVQLITAGAHDLEVIAPTLETAFAALTENS
ncbi:ABC transporter ATP-binding protein [Microbacterium sp. NC79]|uniref:ABC transporter ATP-binding protein n=1 Tax=Microbacterium sp. NC79 TaxID=2851009 RepID=UPI001C2BC73D|nr:ABC transporter ATP-binding protein [Microbacterium sp. NC79]MBV0895462.1 ABC transporter ATP-binding protein [Microbacterium sp. NC79]